jgi:hypothetical protein
VASERALQGVVRQRAALGGSLSGKWHSTHEVQGRKAREASEGPVGNACQLVVVLLGGDNTGRDANEGRK